MIDRYGALAGLVFIVLAIVGFAIEGSPPGVTDAPGEVVDWYGDNVSVSSLESKLIPSWLAGLGVVAGVLILIPVVVLVVIGLIGTALWVAITSVVLFRGSPNEAHN